ncbi:hypothetical protein K2173_025986 [Erythroxylum novogranatense]|uniref:Uncharacterized protein n=1 Tax=Erythroxylum novogranatense TaxID=1862640 RepID=A0AAV8SI03_9ROSI|nr:hypothetical protein K2173_025986 [Erythroxylum novogranatense]
MSGSHPLDLFQCPLNVEPLEGDLKRLSFSTEKLFSKMPLVLLKQEASPSSTDEELVTTGVGDGVSISGESIDHDHEACGNETMDIYYQGMIQTYPGDALLLANYARFLKEVRGDGLKAEEYCERAILTSGGDGNVLSMYGGLVWSNHGDGARAQTYFDRALQSSPDDCYVMASYARFLWE